MPRPVTPHARPLAVAALAMAALAPLAGASDNPPFMELRLHGRLGTEVIAEGVRIALDGAARNGIDAVVFDIDSVGGSLTEARALADLIANSPQGLRRVALVRRATGHAVWPMLACDELLFAPDALVGSAAIEDRELPGVEDPDQAIHTISMDLRLLAERKGHSGAMAQAMIVPAIELWFYYDEAGLPVIADAVPWRSSSTPPSQIDRHDTVLTLTGDRAVTLGVGRLFDPTHPPTRVLQARRHEGASRFAEREMRKLAQQTAAERQAAIERHEAERRERAMLANDLDVAFAELQRVMSEIEALHPTRFTDYRYDYQSGRFQPDSRVRWVERTDHALAEWRKVRVSLQDIRAGYLRAIELGLKPRVTKYEIDGRMMRAQNEILVLSRDRDKRGR